MDEERERRAGAERTFRKSKLACERDLWVTVDDEWQENQISTV